MARKADGAGNYLRSTAIEPLKGSAGPFTVALWFRATNNSQTNTYVVNTGSATFDVFAVLYEYVNNTIEFFASGYSGTNPRTNSGIVVADTAWHHIAYRKAASGISTWDKFLDGVKTSINTSVAFTLSTTTSTFALFDATAALGAAPSKASLADVAIFNTSLSDDDIAALAAGAALPHQFGPAFNWPLWGADSPEMNLVGGGATLTITGTVAAVDGPPSRMFSRPWGDFPLAEAAAPSTFTATADLTTGGAQSSASATFSPPVYSGTAALASGGTEAAATASHTAPIQTAAATPITGGVETAASASFVAPAFTATAALSTGGIETAAAGSFVAPVFTATAGLSTGGLEAAAAALFASVVRSATAGLSSGSTVSAASATYTPPDRTASAGLLLGGVDFAASASFVGVAGTHTATAALVLGSVLFQGGGNTWSGVPRECHLVECAATAAGFAEVSCQPGQAGFAEASARAAGFEDCLALGA